MKPSTFLYAPVASPSGKSSRKRNTSSFSTVRFVFPLVSALFTSLFFLGSFVPSARGATVLSPGQTATFNFDFTSQISPITSVDMYLNVIDISAFPAGLQIGLYDDLNGQGTNFLTIQLSQNVPIPLPSLSTFNFLGSPQVDDGIFSAVFTNFSVGTWTFDFYATANNAAGQSVTLNPPATPLPTSFLLFASGLGLLGLLGLHNKRKKPVAIAAA